MNTQANRLYRRLDGEKILAGVRNVGVGIALGGAAGLFFTGDIIQSIIALVGGLLILVLGSYTIKRGGRDG